MKLTTLNSVKILLSCALLLMVGQTSQAQVLYSADFETNTIANFKIFGGNSLTAHTNDYRVVITNYSTMIYLNTPLNPHPTIPKAPRSTTNGTKGLFVTANRTIVGSTSKIGGVSVYPLNQSFSGNYIVRFDMWCDYNGNTSGGGNRSTEFVTFGVNHAADKSIWATTASYPGDGQWFAITCEGGTGPADLRAYIGPATQPGANVRQDNPFPDGTSGFLDRNGDGFSNTDQDIIWDTATFGLDPYFGPIMPNDLPGNSGQTHGAPGKKWQTVEIKYQSGWVTWSINGYVVCFHNLGPSYTAGDLMLGYMDTITGQPASSESGIPGMVENYAIFDNIEVVNLASAPPVPVVTISATDADASESGSSPGEFRITRAANPRGSYDNSSALAVKVKISGTAANGSDYSTISTNITIPAGSDTVTVPVNVNNDSNGEPTENVTLQLVGDATYEIHSPLLATVNITDDGDVASASVVPQRAVTYENFHVGKFNVGLSGTAPSDVTVNYTLSGTATNGVHYTNITSSSVVIATGFTNAEVVISPINNTNVEPNKTVVLTINPGTGYGISSSSNATVTIRNDDLPPPSSVAFVDNFETNSGSLWRVNADYDDPNAAAIFAYDYGTLDGYTGLPKAPNSTNNSTLGLKLVANISALTNSAVTLSPLSGNYTGDYRVRFDAWINYYGDSSGGLPSGGAGSFEFLTAGVGTAGSVAVGRNNSEGIWFGAVGDASSFNATDFISYKGTNENQGALVAGSGSHAAPYYSEFGLEPAPADQANGPYAPEQSGLSNPGALAFVWHDIVLTKQGTSVTWSIDGLPIAIASTSGVTLSSNVFVGAYDPDSPLSLIPDLAYMIIDNFRVELLTVTPPTTPSISSIQVSGNSVQIDFTGGTSDAASAFTLESRADVASGTFTGAGGTITALPTAGKFRATVTASGTTRFYRIRR